MIIGVDVDLTLVNTDKAWWKWMEMVTGVTKPFPSGDKVTYDLSTYWTEEFEYVGISPFDFWEDPVLYDKLRPIATSVYFINKLRESGHIIRFVSDCKKGHYSSKVRFIKKHFGLLTENGEGFYATKEKFGVYLDAMVDDRASILKPFSTKTLKILYKTPYENGHLLDRDHIDFEADSWVEVVGFIEDLS